MPSANDSSVGQGFFDNPQTTYSPNLEPPGFDLLRDFLMRRIFQLGQNPYGLSQQGSQGMGSQPLFSNQLRPQASLSYMGGNGGQQQQPGQPPIMPETGQARPNMQNQLGGFWQDMQRAGAQSHDGMSFGLPMPGQPTNAGGQKPIGYDGGQMPGYASPNARSINGVMGGGINYVNQLLGGNYRDMNLGPQLNLPGYQFQGGQHEFGGNPNIANAASSAGWDPQMMARWLAQGQQGRNASREATLAQSPGYNASRWGTAAQRQGSGFGLQTAQNNWGRGGTTQPRTWQQMNGGSHSAAGTTPGNDPNSAENFTRFLGQMGSPQPVAKNPIPVDKVRLTPNQTPQLPTEGNNSVTP